MITAKTLNSMLWLEVHYNPTDDALAILASKGKKFIYYLGSGDQARFTKSFQFLRATATVRFEAIFGAYDAATDTTEMSWSADLITGDENEKDHCVSLPVHIFHTAP